MNEINRFFFLSSIMNIIDTAPSILQCDCYELSWCNTQSLFYRIIIYFSALAHSYQIQPTVNTNSKLIISKFSCDVKKSCE